MNFRRNSGVISIAVLAACLASVAAAQAFQRRAQHKLRAIALVEVVTGPSGAVSARLTPIAILDNRRFHDAGVYESRPRPMAIDDGVVYEAQKNGLPVGYVTVTGAQKKEGQWTAQGEWQAVSDVKPAHQTPSAAVPVPGSDRPILRRPGSEPPPAVSSTAPPADAPSKGGGQEDQGRPKLRRSTDTAPSTTAAPPSTTPSNQGNQNDSDRPKLRRQTGTEKESAPPAAPAASQPPGGPTPAKPPAPIVPGVRTLIAISDAEPSHTRSYDYIWKPGEFEQTEKRMRQMAIAQLPPAVREAASPQLANVVIRSFDLDLSNDAVLVLTAEVPATPLVKEGKPGTASGTKKASGKKSASVAKAPPPVSGKPVTRYIALIARVNSEGALVKLASSVTDSSRLDVAPRLEFVDAVDVDGAGPAELLFREYSFDQKGFVIYGVGRSTVTTLFEGASQPVP